LVGKKVICAGACILGEVKGADVDTNTWKITQLYVKLTDIAAEELGYKRRFRGSTVCMPIKLVLAVADVVTIDASLKELSTNNEITDCK